MVIPARVTVPLVLVAIITPDGVSLISRVDAAPIVVGKSSLSKLALKPEIVALAKVLKEYVVIEFIPRILMFVINPT
jgi:hypothetical protein